MLKRKQSKANKNLYLKKTDNIEEYVQTQEYNYYKRSRLNHEKDDFCFRKQFFR
jgi:hypothetical protein